MKHEQKLYIVILAGGKGERLWPLSREKKPKQLLTLSGAETLVELTIDRVKSLTTQDAVWVMTTEAYKKDIQEITKKSAGTIITEPSTRNTGAAILLTCLQIADQDKDATVIFLPADHFIPDADALRAALQKATAYARTYHRIVLLGNKPTFAATGYGYIEYDAAECTDEIYRIAQFHEKPDEQTAAQYIKMPTMLWNGGMFVGNVATFIDEFKHHAPQLYAEVTDFCKGKRSYDDVTSISIDHALMEKSSNLAVLPVTFAWSDIGNLRIFSELKQSLDTHKQSRISYNSTNNLVIAPQKLVALLDVHDLCIIDTDDVLLIGNQHTIEQVKQILQLLKEDGKNDYL